MPLLLLLRMCVLRMQLFFCPSKSSTPSARTDFSPFRGEICTSPVVTHHDLRQKKHTTPSLNVRSLSILRLNESVPYIQEQSGTALDAIPSPARRGNPHDTEQTNESSPRASESSARLAPVPCRTFPAAPPTRLRGSVQEPSGS